jgi:hypothetical protein
MQADKHPLYPTWSNMKQRCYNPNRPDYERYGKRGITVCDTWINDFWAFVKDMGDRPKGYSLERIDNSKGYSPDNCRWASTQEQSENKRNNIWIDMPDGYSYPLCDIAKTHNRRLRSLQSQYLRYGNEGVLRSLGYLPPLRVVSEFTFDGRTQNLSQWCKELGLNFGSFKSTLRRKGYKHTRTMLECIIHDA